jgi:hypothetical protein
MIGYKLFRKRKDNTYGPLFINRPLKLEIGKFYKSESHPTKGFALRPGWHICSTPNAPHLSKKNRVWCVVEFTHKETIIRPKSQGGIWYLGSRMKIIKELA